MARNMNIELTDSQSLNQRLFKRTAIRNVLSLVIANVIFITTGFTVAAQELSTEQLNFFEAKIRPVLIKECYGCHSAKTGATKGGLMVDSKEALVLGGDSGPAVVAGNLDESLLWSAINHEDYNMPPGKMLSAKVLADFKTWIEMGAPDPRVMKIEDIRSEISAKDIENGREFWAFKHPEKPELPRVTNTAWPQSEIDRFVLAKLEEKNLSPADDATAEAVLRRTTFVLTGLPPTAEQIDWIKESYARNPQQAIAMLVDELLDSPQFGERWGRHWLDVARYGESSGREVNLTFPNAWRYRDYVIDSFNNDKPYDRFIQEQIAGDLLPVKTDQQWAENLTATGFLALGPKTLSEQNGRQFRLDLVDEQVDVTSRVILGVSVACARCHDHKFDPIPQTDYYAMSGIFENTSTHYGTIDTLQNRRPSNLLQLPIADPKLAAQKISSKELAAIRAKLKTSQDDLAEAQRQRIQQRRKGTAGNSGQPNAFLNVARLSSMSAALESQLNSYDEAGNRVTQVMGVQEVDKLQPTRLLGRGEFDQPGQVVDRGVPQVLCSTGGKFDKRSSGRAELAAWLGSDQNSLTARVMVNRIWQHMMGQAIVRTPENFGATGQSPTHPALLDWLAVKFVEENWSVKKLIREIAVSRIFRSGSTFNENAFTADPTNELLWRYQPKRLDAEAIRDAMLAIAGELDTQRPYASLVNVAGQGLVRDGIILAASQPTPTKATRGDRRKRNRSSGGNGMMSMSSDRGSITRIDQPAKFRSVYLPVVRDNVTRSMGVFDFAESSMVIGTRETSNTPDQGLYFLNNQFVVDQSEAFARRLMAESNEPSDQIKQAFLLAYGRESTENELAAAREFYENFSVSGSRFSRGRSRDETALKKLSALCQGIFASAEFRFLN